MADRVSKEVRSRNMAAIKGANTKPEELVRKYLFSKGFRYRKNVRSLPGSPDVVLPKYKTVIFVNGCFWHMHDCKWFKWPKSNADFWREKITKNVERDARNKEALEKDGWQVLTVWECELKTNFEDTMSKAVSAIKTMNHIDSK